MRFGVGGADEPERPGGYVIKVQEPSAAQTWANFAAEVCCSPRFQTMQLLMKEAYLKGMARGSKRKSVELVRQWLEAGESVEDSEANRQRLVATCGLAKTLTARVAVGARVCSRPTRQAT